MIYSTENLLSDMKLSLNSKIQVKNKIFKVVNHNDWGFCLYCEKENVYYPVTFLVDKKMTILSNEKKVGDLNCEDVNCSKCAIRVLCTGGPFGSTLFNEFKTCKEDLKNCDIFDKEIFDLLEKRLNEVVE